MSDYAGLSNRAIIGRFFKRLEIAQNMSLALQLGMLFDSDQASEEYKWLGMVPAMEEWVGERKAKGLPVEGFKIQNKKYSSVLEVSLDDKRRDKTGQVDVRIADQVVRANSHWMKLISLLIQQGESKPCYDGQFFFDTDHEEGDSGVQSNIITSADFGELNVAAPTNPTADELANVIMKSIQHMYSIKDNAGEPANDGANNFVVVVPNNMSGNATLTVKKEHLAAASGQVRDNPLFGSGANIQILPDNRLTWTDRLAIFRVDSAVKPFILQEELPITVSALAEGSDLEFEHDAHRYGIKAVRGAGYGMWQHGVLAKLS